MTRFWRRVLVLVIALLAVPTLASAHAGLESSDPAPGSYLDVSPRNVILTFDEPITTAFGSLRVLDSDGVALIEAPLRRGESKEIALADVDEVLDDGTYVVVWRVTSSDGHPVQGSFTFVVGDSADEVGSAAITATAVTHGLSRLFVVIRASVFVSLALLIGAIFLLWASGARRLSQRTAIFVRGAWVVLFAATIESFFAFGPHAAGVKIYKAFDGDLLSATLTTTYGRAQIVRLVFLVALWPVLSAFIEGARRRAVIIPLLLGVVATVSVSGHAVSTSPMLLGVALDIVHLFAIGSWIGGLCVLVYVSRRLEDERVLTLTTRFSSIAQRALPIIVVTGAAQTWLLVDDMGKIFDTEFGRTLVVKVALVLVVIALSGTARRALKRRDVANLRTTIAFEVVVALVVLAVTASLTGLSPKAESSTAPFQQTVVGSEVFVTLAVTPARVGQTEVHLIMARQGGVLGELTDVEMRMGLSSMNIPPGPVEITRIAPNHYTAEITFAFPGRWSIEVLARTEPFAVSRFAFEVPISE